MNVLHADDTGNIVLVAARRTGVLTEASSSKHIRRSGVIVFVGIRVPAETLRDEPAGPMRLLALHDE